MPYNEPTMRDKRRCEADVLGRAYCKQHGVTYQRVTRITNRTCDVHYLDATGQTGIQRLEHEAHWQ